MPESYLPLGARQKAVTIVFSLIALLAVMAVVSDALELQLYDRIIAGEDVTTAEGEASDARQGAIGLAQFVFFVAGAVVFIRWLHAAYKNVDVVAPNERRYGHGWAIGSWFVPFLNLWRPKQIVNDVWRAGAATRGDAEPGKLLLAWWSLWVISNWVDNVAFRLYLRNDTVEALRTGSIAYICSDVIDLLTAILAILVVRRATDRLDGRAAATQPPEGQPPEGALDAPERPAGVQA